MGTKGSAFAAKITKTGKHIHILDCVVADAVLVEPVSIPKFPANREKNREFPALGSKHTYAAETEAVSGFQRLLAAAYG